MITKKKKIKTLKAIREGLELAIELHKNEKDYSYSLCSLSRCYASQKGNAWFIQYLFADAKRRRTIYYNEDEKEVDFSLFAYHWKPRSWRLRLSWLDKQIRIFEL